MNPMMLMSLLPMILSFIKGKSGNQLADGVSNNKDMIMQMMMGMMNQQGGGLGGLGGMGGFGGGFGGLGGGMGGLNIPGLGNTNALSGLNTSSLGGLGSPLAGLNLGNLGNTNPNPLSNILGAGSSAGLNTGVGQTAPPLNLPPDIARLLPGIEVTNPALADVLKTSAASQVNPVVQMPAVTVQSPWTVDNVDRLMKFADQIMDLQVEQAGALGIIRQRLSYLEDEVVAIKQKLEK